VYDKLAVVDDVDEVHVVTNARFADDFREWAGHGERPVPVVVHDDQTTSNDDRLGAIGDVQYVLDAADLDGEDLLVVAGDNLFEFELREFVAFWRSKRDGSAICVRQVDDLELMRQYAMVELAEDGRVTLFVEKPEDPTSTLAAIAVYLYRAEHVPLVRAYLAEGNAPDQPGRFIAWLYSRAPVYAYRFPGAWLDIGDREQLLEADNWVRRERGLPTRAEYSLEK
jgi:glucose-1-phosphate thymidylyltransferase